MLTKGLWIYFVARITKAGHAIAIERAVMMAQGGEFAFVLFFSGGDAFGHIRRYTCQFNSNRCDIHGTYAAIFSDSSKIHRQKHIASVCKRQ